MLKNRLPVWPLMLLLASTGCRQSQPTARLSAVPTHDLSHDEDAGGHTLHRHVGRTDAQLRARLQQEPYISVASTYSNRATAERVVGEVLQQDQSRIERWLERSGGHPNLVLDYDGDPAHPVGRILRRGENTSQPSSHAIVVLRWAGGGEYYVLTSYPEYR